MKVKFLEDVDISGKIDINKGCVFEAEENEDFLMIKMPDGSTIKAPKSEANGILEIVK